VRVEATAIADVKLIRPAVYADDRGYFLEMWRTDRLVAAGIEARIVQENRSHSVKGALRGLHYQIRRPQGKLVSVISGRIFDVAVDLRRSSPSFGKWVGKELSGAEKAMLWVPVGFAHGFLTLSETADVLYGCTDTYLPDAERTLLWSDPDLAVSWPLGEIARPVVSEKDAKGTAFKQADLFP
jgi:dTDP-4-dehydrorhamnose 3,5-epimerase